MPLDVEQGEKVLQLVTARYDRREWRKKIEKILSLPPGGLADDAQRKIFLHLKRQLQVYKSRRADTPSWIVGGYATQEVVDRARLRPTEIDPQMTETDVSFLGVDPGDDVDAAWWDAMLVTWFETPGEDGDPFGDDDDESDDVDETDGVDKADAVDETDDAPAGRTRTGDAESREDGDASRQDAHTPTS